MQENTVEGKEPSLAETANIVAEKVGTDQTFPLGDTTVTVYKVKTKNLGTILGLINTSFSLLGITKIGDLPKLDLENPQILLQLISKMHEPIIEASADLSSLSVEDVNDLDLDDMLKLVMRIINLNKSFFLERVLPSLKSESGLI